MKLPVFTIYLIYISNALGYRGIIYPKSTDQISTHCYNPNGRTGACISIFECESLKYILVNRIESQYRFVSYSQCYNGVGKAPFVCCTNDTHFGQTASEQQIGKEEVGDRIVFPNDDIEEQSSHLGTTTAPKITEAHSNTNAAYKQKPLLPKPPNCGGVSILNKIFGGIEAELTEFSWMVNLEYLTASGRLVSVCSGSLINERYVITAAHCVVGDIEQKVGHIVSIRVGDHNTHTDFDCDSHGHCLPPYQRIGIESIAVPKNYGNDFTLGIHQHHDIALIRLNHTINSMGVIEPICLSDVQGYVDLTPGMKLTVAGWGHNGTAKYTAEKRKVAVPIVDHAECRRIYTKTVYVANEQLCAGGVFQEDSCTGDSGGPLMRYGSGCWVLEGIVSFGRGCGLEQPGIYTNVRFYMDWIMENIKP